MTTTLLPAPAPDRPSLCILGGGQLAFFMAQAAKRLSADCTIIAAEPAGPASAATRYLQHPLTDAEAFSALAADGHTFTFDFEAIPPVTLDALIDQGNPCTSAQATVLRKIQNKRSQKRWLKAAGFATPAFVSLDLGPEERQLPESLAKEAAALGLPVVQKLATGGYDGKGVQILRSPAALDALWPGASYLEAFVPRMQELTVIVTRALDGALQIFDPAATFFDAEGQCLDYWIAPAPVEASLMAAARQLAGEVIDALKGAGTYAVELFAAEDGSLLVNEISARVHNAGHHTLEGHAASQFDQHVRAVLGLPLVDMALTAPVAVAQNLLAGRHAVDALLGAEAGALQMGTATLHWYGKHEARPLRKMGHITATGNDSNDAKAAITAVLASLEAGQFSPEAVASSKPSTGIST